MAREASKIELDDTVKSRTYLQTRERMRNLKQYKSMSDDEFDDVYAKKAGGVDISKEFEGRIEKKIEEFSKDYDLEDLNSNDKLILRNLAQAMISLEDYETITYNLRGSGVNLENYILLEKIEKMKDDLSDRISKMQGDLKITRKVRESDKAVTVVDYIDNLKRKAKEFYKSRMLYVFCPKCGMLLGTVWSLYADNDKNRIVFLCERKLENDEKCGEKVIIGTKELIEKGGSNRPELLTEAMK